MNENDNYWYWIDSPLFYTYQFSCTPTVENDTYRFDMRKAQAPRRKTGGIFGPTLGCEARNRFCA